MTLMLTNLENEFQIDRVTHSIENTHPSTPGIGNLIFAPLNIIWGVYQAFIYSAERDYEGLKQAIFKLISGVTALIHSVPYTMSVVNDYVHTFLSSTTTLLTTIPIIGYVLCGLGFIQESIELIKQVLFSSKLYSSSQSPRIISDTKDELIQFINISKEILEKIDQDFFKESKDKLLKSLTDLENNLNNPNYTDAHQFEGKIKAGLMLYNFQIIDREYFKLSETNAAQLRNLAELETSGIFHQPDHNFVQAKTISMLANKAKKFARRVQPWLLKEYVDNASQLQAQLSNILGQDEVNLAELEKATQIIDKINAQSRKAVIIHIVALTALSITIASLAVSLITVPFVPAGFAIAAGVFSVVAWMLKSGMLPSQGYQLNIKYLIPGWIRELFGMN